MNLQVDYMAPTTFVNNYSRETGYSEAVARDHFVEVVKFLVVSSESKEICSPSANLDKAWHSFVLCTRDYSQFCHINFQQFIHHTPTNQPEVGAYARTRALALAKYGQLDTYLWPEDVAKAADCWSSCDGDGYCSDGGCTSDCSAQVIEN